MRLGPFVKATVVLAAASTLLVACGGGGGADAGGRETASAAKPTGPAPTGSEVKLMIIGVRNNPVLTQQQMFAAAQAKVDHINDSGGINGHR